MPFSNVMRDQIWNSICRGVDFVPPVSLHLGLFMSDTGLNDNDLTVAVEADYGNYSRVGMREEGFLQTIAESTDGTTTNITPYSFPRATVSGGAPTHVAILDAAENGNVIAWGPMSMFGGPRPIEASLGFVIGAEQLQLILG